MAIILINVQRDDNYLVQIEIGSLTTTGQRLKSLEGNKRVVVITDNKVEKLYGFNLVKNLQDYHINAQIFAIPEGESSKSIDVAVNLIDRLVESGVKRRDLILALGGGVITDLAGFVAATYMRGIPYINIPTTLLAQLDASIGGKVAVNHRYGKNLIGAFYHPSAVYIDPETLVNLSREEICNGLAEAIKVAVIHSQELFEFIERNCEQLLQRDIPLLAELVTQAARAKVELLESDPYERNLRRVLNFGHSIGHVLEILSGYNQKLSHGQAISIGMATATRIAVVKGICQAETAEKILALLQKAELPTQATEINISSFQDGLQVIRAIRDGSLNLVLPTNIGTCTILSDLSSDIIVQNLGGFIKSDCSRQLRRQVKSYGLTISALGNHAEGQLVLGPHHQDTDSIFKGTPSEKIQYGMDRMKKTAQVAADLEVPVVCGFCGCEDYSRWFPWPNEHGWEEMSETFVERWIEILDTFKTYGVKFAHECHPKEYAYNVETAELTVSLLEGHESWGFNLDPANLMLAGVDPVVFIQNLGDRIYHVHAKDGEIVPHNVRRSGLLAHGDWARIDRGFRFRIPGWGDLPWRKIITELRLVNYDYVLAVEHEDPTMSRDDGVAKGIAYMNYPILLR